MKPRKILKISESREWSGGAAQMLALAEGLRSRGIEVQAACPPGGELWERLRREGFDLFPFDPFQDYDLRTALRLARWVRRERPDLVHAHHPRAHAMGLLASWTSRRFPPIVVTRRVSFRVSWNPFSALKYRSRRIAGYIAVAESIRGRLTEGGVEASRIEVIPSGTEPGAYAPRRRDAELARELRLGQGPVVGKIANFGPSKGQEHFLKAAAIVARRRPIVFVLAGRDTDSPEAKAMAERFGVADKVRLLGFRRDVPRLLSCLDVSVNAAVAGEGISGAIRESMAMGVPVVASDAGGNRELVEDGTTGRIFPAGSAEVLAERILALLDEPGRARRLAEAGREKVLEAFSVERMVERTAGFYERILDPRARRAASNA